MGFRKPPSHPGLLWARTVQWLSALTEPCTHSGRHFQMPLLHQYWVRQRLQAELPEVLLMLSSLLSAGIAIEQALRYTSDACSHRASKAYLKALRDGVRDGQSLSSVTTEVVPTWLMVMLRTAELTGELSKILTDWSTQTIEQKRWIADIRRKAAYPLLLLVGTFVTMMVIGNVVIPQFEHMYLEMGQPIPSGMRTVMGVWHLVPELMGAVLVISTLWVVAGHIPGVVSSRVWKSCKRHLPGHQLIVLHRTHRFCFTLALLTDAGLPLLDALTAMGNVHRERWLSQVSREIAEQVSTGARLSRCFDGEWDPLLALQIQRAEISGDLSDALLKTEVLTRAEFIRRIERIRTWLEPSLSVAVGLLIGVTMYSLYVPMYTLISDIS